MRSRIRDRREVIAKPIERSGQAFKTPGIWKPDYDKHAGARKVVGLNHDHVLQAVENPNAVTMVMDISDFANAKTFS